MTKHIVPLIMVAFSLFVLKTFISDMTLAESIASVGCLTFLGFVKYSEYHAAIAIEKDYESRLKSLENKLTFLSGGSIVNQKTRR